MRNILLAVIAILLFVPNFFNTDIIPSLSYDKKEKFDSRLSYINSIKKLEDFTDSIAAAQKINTTSYNYVELLETVIENRFYHGFSHFTLSENWMAAIAGRFIKEDCACKVQPEKIIQQKGNAACSQQALVMMAVLRNKKIDYRSVGFPHHYAMEVLINNNWYFFDANMEPSITKAERMLPAWNHQNDNLKKHYDPRRFTDLDYKFGNGLTATTGIINEVPARNARLFQSTTGILSKIIWCFPVFLIFYRPRFSVIPKLSIRFKRKKPSLSLSV